MHAHSNRFEMPSLAIVVPTRNRPQHVFECAQCILAAQGVSQVIVVDQSDGPETGDLLSTIDDRRLRYVHSDTRGVTTARNLGIDLSDTEFVAFTDDDCRIAADWVPSILKVFEDPQAAVICGRVIVPTEIQHLGYAADFEPQVREWQGRYPPLGSDWGITANFSIRRSILESVGGFDPFLGAGAPLRSGGEPDFLFRVLRAGFKVVNASEVVVLHYGIRKPGLELKRLIASYANGIGAALFKHVRLGDPVGVWVYLRFLSKLAVHLPVNLVRRKRPTGAGFLLAFLGGTVASYRFGIDRERRCYVER